MNAVELYAWSIARCELNNAFAKEKAEGKGEAVSDFRDNQYLKSLAATFEAIVHTPQPVPAIVLLLRTRLSLLLTLSVW